MSVTKEQAVRDAAARLAEAIADARGEGLVVTWPARAEDLSFISVSAGRKAMTPAEIGAAAQAQAEREQGGAVTGTTGTVAADPAPRVTRQPPKLPAE